VRDGHCDGGSEHRLVFFIDSQLNGVIGSITGAILDLRKDLEMIVEEISAVLGDHLPKDT
jgi:hypothetical protein